ncbi:DeoR/GlpR family DNA-binding transcription regulator [Mesobacterium sp. TK19101]|uniref:DeoR/GlpR family DNA-binding transcription regulator n=1 Tax=Mesobacterium hydrothermale TaxID=3111907 RepID=A0ABU6HI92_9RHOB|nr:DeoR/GlpR family DNA-binding transcription regulator [Mesobacterium sp. TK19101]
MLKQIDTHHTHREVELLETLRSLGGSARTAALAEALNVSEETVRRTVKALAKADLVQRVHGGVYLTNVDAYAPVHSRLNRNAAEKMRIANSAAAMIPNGASVFLDVGSTTTYLAERLKDHRNLTVVTNAINAAQALVGRNHNQVFLAGGEMREAEFGTFGPETAAYIARFNIDIAVLSVDGVDAQAGFLLAGSAEADLARSVAAQARRVIVVADQSKFGQGAPMVAFPAEQADVLITDSALRPPFQHSLDAWQVEVVLAGA